jgi:hypothetical protein
MHYIFIAIVMSMRSRYNFVSGDLSMLGQSFLLRNFVIISVRHFFPRFNYYYYYLFKLQMGFYPVAVYYNKTQHTNNTHHTNNTPHSNNHSTQNDTNNKGHTTNNEYNYNATNTIKTTIK